MQTPTFPVLDFQKQIIKKKTASKKSESDVECLWVDKYKPICTKDVLGNSEIVKELKNWLVPNKKNLKKTKKGQLLLYTFYIFFTLVFNIYTIFVY